MNSPGGHYFIARFAGKLIPPRARYVILLGHAQDTENYIFQKSIRVRGRSAKKYVTFLKIASPTSFSVYVIFFCVDSRVGTLSGGIRENEPS